MVISANSEKPSKARQRAQHLRKLLGHELESRQQQLYHLKEKHPNWSSVPSIVIKAKYFGIQIAELHQRIHDLPERIP